MATDPGRGSTGEGRGMRGARSSAGRAPEEKLIFPPFSCCYNPLSISQQITDN